MFKAGKKYKHVGGVITECLYSDHRGGLLEFSNGEVGWREVSAYKFWSEYREPVVMEKTVFVGINPNLSDPIRLLTHKHQYPDVIGEIKVVVTDGKLSVEVVS